MLIKRKVLLRLNLHDYKGRPQELKQSILALSMLEVAANDWQGGTRRHTGPRKKKQDAGKT